MAGRLARSRRRVARDYLVPFEAARGRVFDRDQWISILLAKYPAEEYLCQLAAR